MRQVDLRASRIEAYYVRLDFEHCQRQCTYLNCERILPQILQVLPTPSLACYGHLLVLPAMLRKEVSAVAGQARKRPLLARRLAVHVCSASSQSRLGRRSTSISGRV